MLNVVKTFLETIGRFAINHEPEILTTVGAAGTVTSVVFAWKGGAKTSRELERLQYESEDIPTLKDKAKVVAPIMAPVVATTAGSIACFALAHRTLAKRNMALASLYSLTEAAYKDYKDKVEETVGKNKAKKIREEIAKDKIEKNPPIEDYILWTGHGEQLCYDALFGRYFRSDAEYIRKCVNDINELLLLDNYVALNEFYERLNLPPIKIGNDLGWRYSDQLLWVTFSSELAFNNQPVLIMDYAITPEFNYDAFA